MSTSDAWLLECGDSLLIAVGDHQMVEYIQGPFCYSVPASPSYCDSVLLWHDNFIPVMDLAALYDQPIDQTDSVICLLNYQPAANEPLLQIAIRTNKAPIKIQVEDEQVCELSDSIKASPLSFVALTSFMMEISPVVIIDINKLCSAEFRDSVTAAT